MAERVQVVAVQDHEPFTHEEPQAQKQGHGGILERQNRSNFIDASLPFRLHSG
jgi:hypothetical protein